MNSFKHMSFLALLGGGALVAPAAQAATPDEVAGRVKELFARQGVDLVWAAAEGNGSGVVLNGVTIGVPGQAERIPVGLVNLKDIEEEDDGDFTVGTLDMPRYTYAVEGMDFAVDGLSISGLLLPGANSTDPMAAVGIFEALEIARFGATMGGKEAFALENLVYQIERSDDGDALTFTGSTERFSADLSALGDPDTLAMAAALGLSDLKGSFETAGGWSLSDGQLTLEQMDFTVDNAGTLGVTFDLGGYTAEVAQAMRDMQQQMASVPEDQKSAQGLAYLGLLQQLSLGGVSVRYDDNQLAGRALDMAAGMQRMKRSDLSGLARMMLPTYLSQYVGPEFAGQVTEEVAKFLDDPRSLEISAEPAEPVPFALIGAGVMTAPQSLPAQIGLTVKANE